VLKPQDTVLLVKLLSNPEHLNWSQSKLATHLCLSVSAVNASLKRLSLSGLIRLGMAGNSYSPVLSACEEYLISSVKYVYPAEIGDYTVGIPTSYAAPIFKGQIALGKDPIPVWPNAKGTQRGLALAPLYHCVTNSLLEYPDQGFYDLLSLVDAIRHGRARERTIAEKLLKERLRNA